jgi:hypothetical protein
MGQYNLEDFGFFNRTSTKYLRRNVLKVGDAGKSGWHKSGHSDIWSLWKEDGR